MGPLHAGARRLVAQLGEVDVEVVVGRLVVQVDSELSGWDLVALQDGLLSHNETGGAINITDKTKTVTFVSNY